MKHGVPLNVCHLKVGDIVRPIRGGNVRGTQPNIQYTLTDGITKRTVQTHGWGCPVLGGPEDFRQGYDAMTVVRLDDDTLTFLRPYFHVDEQGQVTTCGVEFVEHVSRTGNTWYELLS